jgi:hypothetical protein
MFCLYLKSIAKYIFVLWKVSFSVPKLDVKFTHLGEGLSVDNNVTGINFTSTKSLPQDDVEEAMPHFDVQIDLSEIHVLLYCFIFGLLLYLLVAIQQSALLILLPSSWLEKTRALCWKFLKLLW